MTMSANKCLTFTSPRVALSDLIVFIIKFLLSYIIHKDYTTCAERIAHEHDILGF